MAKVRKKSTTKVAGTVRVDAYSVMRRAVEEGVRYGWNRAHKHTDTPDDDVILEAIEDAVVNAITEFILFEDTYE